MELSKYFRRASDVGTSQVKRYFMTKSCVSQSHDDISVHVSRQMNGRFRDSTDRCISDNWRRLWHSCGRNSSPIDRQINTCTNRLLLNMFIDAWFVHARRRLLALNQTSLAERMWCVTLSPHVGLLRSVFILQTHMNTPRTRSNTIAANGDRAYAFTRYITLGEKIHQQVVSSYECMKGVLILNPVMKRSAHQSVVWLLLTERRWACVYGLAKRT